MDPQDQRDDLIEKAKYGKITGAEADAKAVELGVGSLSRMPSPEEFRPETVPQWTLPMAVAWIAYLDLDEVREWMAPYREACWDWHWQKWRVGVDGPIYQGWHLEQRHKPTLSLLGIGASYHQATAEKPLAMSIKDARESLWVALREGLFSASGIPFESDRRMEIPALEWHELVAVEGNGERDEVRRGLMGAGYSQVLMPSGALRSLWRRQPNEKLTLPETQAPTGDGYMPLYCAAQWIATKAATISFDPNHKDAWRAAFSDLMAAIASEKVRVIGTRHGQRETVEAHHFADCEVDYPFSDASMDLQMGDDFHLRSYPFIDEKHWRNGFDDALVKRGDAKWSRLLVNKADIRVLWPIVSQDAVLTGLPGRPALSKHLMEDELQRRGKARQLADTLGEEAEALLNWLKEHHPEKPRPKLGTVRNNIRDEYRRLKGTK